MISPEQNGLWRSHTGSLPDDIAVHLTRAVEVALLVDRKSLPHELMLEELRPALRRLNGSERTPTPLRAFCMPFEDLFSDVPRKTFQQKGRIARDSVAPIWTWLSQTLLPVETKNYCRNFKSAIAAANHADSKAIAASFWPVAAGSMRTALACDSGRRTARRILTNDLVVADAEEAALLLGVARAVMAIQEILPKPTPVLSDELLRALRAIHDGLIRTAPEATPYVAMIAMNRLARPWEAFKLTHDISGPR